MNKSSEVIIIGGGIAGLSAAIQLKRSGVPFILFEKNELGGLLKNANLIENYPGFPNGISGLELCKLLKSQAEKLSIDFNKEQVILVERNISIYKIHTNSGIYESNFLIIATGTKPKQNVDFEIPNAVNKLVHFEITGIMKEVNKKIVIIGAGDIAFDYAISLSNHNEVMLLNRSSELKCLPLLYYRIITNPNFIYKENTEIKFVSLKENLLDIICYHEDSFYEIGASHLVIAIGREADLDFLDDNLRTNLNTFTKDETLFLIGDVKNNLYRQTAICAGDGVITAMKIFNKIKLN